MTQPVTAPVPADRQEIEPTERAAGRQTSGPPDNWASNGTPRPPNVKKKDPTAPQGISVRRAVPGDLNALEGIEQGCFGADGDAFPRRQLAYLVQKARGACYVACDAERIVGYTSLLTRRTARNVRIYSIAVAPSARGCGVGHILIAEAIAHARREGFREVTLEVRTDNIAALALYAKSGFTTGKLLCGYYHDGADARRMVLHLE